ncbi:MAG TPA: glucokinase [Terriglobales bacterium]|nr:glucokinase [Terriglobales bacterium]
MILAGDVGGTKANLALFRKEGDTLRVAFQSRLATRDYTGIESLVDAFLQKAPAAGGDGTTIDAAAFGVAGVVVDGQHYSENLPWLVDASSLKQRLNLRHVGLLNDLAATALSLPRLPPADFVSLNVGIPMPHGALGVIAAGTGLGEALLFWDGSKYRVAGAEGGMTDFTPRTERDIRLLSHLKTQLANVCCEDVVSGRGFRRIHEFLDASVRHESFDAPGASPAAEITQRALEKSCPVCLATLDWWVELLGATTGNFVLQTMSLGGVYIAGGIAVKILSKLKEASFFKSFCGASKLAPMLANVPISVVLNEDAPMWGAAYHALGSLDEAHAR